MKKLFISVFAIALTLTACTKEETQESSSYSNYKNTTNRFKYSYDLTNDGIENFIIQPKEYQGIYIFEYKGNEKKLTVSTVNNTTIQVAQTFIVDSEKSGKVNCHLDDFYCVFEFVSTKQVNQTFKNGSGEKQIIYSYQ